MAYRPYETDEMQPEQSATELASPWARLAAWIIDILIYIAVIIPSAAVGFFIVGEEFGAPVFAVVAFIVVFIIQMVLLGSRGQTIGKIALKVRVVDSVTGMHPGWARIVLLRTVVNWVLTSIPFIGGIYWLVDSLFIFREDHRTIHDMIGGTRVDKVTG